MNKDASPEIRAETLLTSYQVGSLLQVNPSSVNKWVKDGRIPAFRTPGGHRRIRAIDLVAFLNKHEMPVPGSLRHAAQRRLLIVDGDRGAPDRVRSALNAHAQSVDVQSVDSGIDALVKVGSFKPHAILLDADTKDVDWREMCRRLKANAETREISVLVTGSEGPDLAQTAQEAGVQHCASKPPPSDVLLRALGIVGA